MAAAARAHEAMGTGGGYVPSAMRNADIAGAGPGTAGGQAARRALPTRAVGVTDDIAGAYAGSAPHGPAVYRPGAPRRLPAALSRAALRRAGLRRAGLRRAGLCRAAPRCTVLYCGLPFVASPPSLRACPRAAIRRFPSLRACPRAAIRRFPSLRACPRAYGFPATFF
jgi:hypothetical protein